ncbi:MAG: transposase [Bacteroidales bacterium]|nr:transposase [Bacteroidales bacterium]
MKIHACVTCEGFPLSITISPGNEYDSKRFIEVMETTKIETGRRPRTKPSEVLADSAYDNSNICGYLRSRLIKSNIPVNKRNQKKRRRG